MKIKRIKSGVHGFDKLCHGGFVENSYNIVAGGAGTGKSLFAMQFLYEGLKKGEKCLYVSFEETEEKIYNEMKLLGMDLQKYKSKLNFLEYSSKQVKFLLEEGGGAIEEIIVKKKITRMVIDSITTFYMMYPDQLSKIEAGLAIYNLLKKWKCTSIVTSNLRTSYTGIPLDENISLDFKSDSAIYLYNMKNNEKRLRGIEILKMHNTAHSNLIHLFDINKQGLKLKKKILKH